MNIGPTMPPLAAILWIILVGAGIAAYGLWRLRDSRFRSDGDFRDVTTYILVGGVTTATIGVFLNAGVF
ncbi:hypothetical protein ACFTWF_34870 [Rhodococcus sp. NPDC056960]|uniref:hypothetical protein n=1 Tax=Rhodococcus sp. NPDC056960 TaxID=3345982 RepID=UPI0036270B07